MANMIVDSWTPGAGSWLRLPVEDVAFSTLALVGAGCSKLAVGPARFSMLAVEDAASLRSSYKHLSGGGPPKVSCLWNRSYYTHPRGREPSLVPTVVRLRCAASLKPGCPRRKVN